MVRNIKEVLKELGWSSGFSIPVANEENKEFEKEVEEKIKKKAGLLIKIEVLNDSISSMKKHLKGINDEKDQNQQLLITFAKELNSEENLLHNVEAEIRINSNEITKMKKDIEKLEEKEKKLQDELSNLNIMFSKLKETLQWGEEELLTWEMNLNRGEQDFMLLNKFKIEDENKFHELETRRQLATKDYMATKSLQLREYEKYDAFKCQLAQSFKLVKQMKAEKLKLIYAWEGTILSMNERENVNQKLVENINEIKKKARKIYLETVEKREFVDNQKQINNDLEKCMEKMKDKMDFLGGQKMELGKELENAKGDNHFRYRLLAELGVKISSQRKQNSHLAKTIEDKTKELEATREQVFEFTQNLDTLNEDSMTEEQRYINAEEIYQVGLKAQEQGTVELDKMQDIIFNLRTELGTLKEKEILSKKDLQILKQDQELLDSRIAASTKEIDNLDFTLYKKEIEFEHCLRKVEELSEKSATVLKREFLEAKVLETEEKIRDATKQCNIAQSNLRSSKNALYDLNVTMKQGEKELDDMYSEIKELKLRINGGLKEMNLSQNRYNQSVLQFSLIKMQADCTEKNMNKEESYVTMIEHERIQLEAAMKEKNLEIDVRKKLLLGKKKILQEESSSLRKSVEQLNARIKLLQKRYEIATDLLGKNEEGEKLSVTQLKIKTAQEKYELQSMGDDLENKINTVEIEIEAMENTLKLVNAVNDNFKSTLEAVEEDSPEVSKFNTLELEYVVLVQGLKEKQNCLKALTKEIKTVETNLDCLYEKEEVLRDEWKTKDTEAVELERDLSNKQLRLDRATSNMCRLSKDVRKMKESPMLKQYAQRDINLRMKNDQNQNALQKLADLVVGYIETGPVIKNFMTERGIPFMQSRLSTLTQSSHSRLSIPCLSNTSVEGSASPRSSRSSEGSSRTPTNIFIDSSILSLNSGRKESTPTKKS